jgi:hypothetical protein
MAHRNRETKEVVLTKEGLANRTGDLSLLEAKQLPLFSPVDRYLRCQSHQLLGGELWWVFAVDDCRDDVGRQRGKTQEAIDIVCGDSFLAGDNVHGEIGVLHQTFLDFVSPSDNP